jgi:hypothetical protein
MGRYIVERTFPQSFELAMNEQGLQACLAIIEQNSVDGVTWLQSYVTLDHRKCYCLYDGPTPEAIRRAASRNDLPLDRITEVCVLDPYFYHSP